MKTKKNKKISSFSQMYSSDEMIMVLNEQVRAYTESLRANSAFGIMCDYRIVELGGFEKRACRISTLLIN